MVGNTDSRPVGRWKPNSSERVELHQGGTQGVQKQVDLEFMDCTICKQPAKEIIGAAAKVRQGWYCIPCENFMKAYQRERKL